MTALTVTELDFLAYRAVFTELEERAPSIGEVQRYLGFASKTSAVRLVAKMRRSIHLSA